MRVLMLVILFVVVIVAPPSSLAATVVHHDLDVTLNPAGHSLSAVASLSFPEDKRRHTVVFRLHDGLTVKALEGGITQQQRNAQTLATTYTAQTTSEGRLRLQYSGQISHDFQAPSEEYARSFLQTRGMISDKGVFLERGSYWFPSTDHELFTFDLKVHLPDGWTAVSQGERQRLEPVKSGWESVSWRATQPQNDLYLIAGQFHEYTKSFNRIEAQVYLRDDDPALAQKYIDATGRYLAMYVKMLGPYPYSKFALVENFWETGYGMPSFTLLGPRVIRLPFILHSSYPHEILHNWWGNGVYVDFRNGNWAEGLTAYMADHLIREQRGKASEHRRTLLQNYMDYVSESDDFPLARFVNRHSSSSEAIGYGKSLMLFHMLRIKLGDRAFIEALRQLYREYKFKHAGFEDLQTVFSQVYGSDLSAFFQQWVHRDGAPNLSLENVHLEQQGEVWQLGFDVVQNQNALFDLDVPVLITLADGSDAGTTAINTRSNKKSVELTLSQRPEAIALDPLFDVFRRVDRRETPPTLSHIFGAEDVLMVLPSLANTAMRRAYEALVEEWKMILPGSLEAIYDDQVKAPLIDKSVWIVGAENLLRAEFAQHAHDYAIRFNGHETELNGESLSDQQDHVIAVTRNKSQIEHAWGYISAANVNAVAGLARKLPHYRRYSALSFSGDEPTINHKVTWPVLASPLVHYFNKDAVLKPKEHTALAQLPAAFSASAMMKHVRALSAPEMQGRGLKTEGLDKAADYLEQAFKRAGLKPYEGDRYAQTWQQNVDGIENSVTLRNIIGVVPGKNPKHQHEALVVTAHYDHLGFGWPDVRKGSENKLHPGADDNASGIAVMLEVAKALVSRGGGERTVVFIAFTAEEAGLLGSRHFVKNPSPFSLDKTIAVVNLDAVGRHQGKPLKAMGVGTAREWVHILRGIGFVSGIHVTAISDDHGGSDQRSFIEAGVPGIQLFGEVHQDYHRHTDTIDKIEPDSLVNTAVVLNELVDYLGNRPEMLNVTLKGKRSNSPVRPRPGRGRKVSLGTIPDFAFGGPGVRLTGTVTDSPVDKAGLKAGDILVEAQGKRINNLGDYAQVLRMLQPGQKIHLKLRRDGESIEVEVVAESR